MVEGKVRAGFPSPADDFALKELDLMDLLVKRPLATFFMQVRGTSMEGAGVPDGCIVVVDRSMKPEHGCIVVAEVDGQFTCKVLHKRGGIIKLVAANPEFPDITLQDGQQLTVCGVVTSAITRFTS
jgi:DNA polymerase V